MSVCVCVCSSEVFRRLFSVDQQFLLVDSMTDKVKVHVYAGGRECPQLGPFQSVQHVFSQILHVPVEIEILYKSDLRDRNWSPSELVNWLLESNFHFILTHPHQGNFRWDCTEVYDALKELKEHRGFPRGEKLECPIFSQHKFRYLCAVPEIVNPTIAIPMPRMEKSMDKHGNVRFISCASISTFDTAELHCFLERNNEGRGWVLKFPFVTVKEGMKFCKTKAELLHQLDIATGKFGGRIPYAMVQPCLVNRKEYKVVVLDGKAHHILPQKYGVCKGVKDCKSFSSYPHLALFRFAELSVELLRRRCIASHADGLIRVDVMQTLEKNFVVNEFESLEAAYAGNSIRETSQTHNFLREYWAKNVFDCLGESIK